VYLKLEKKARVFPRKDYWHSCFLNCLLSIIQNIAIFPPSAKQSGAYDDGQYHGQCYFIEPSVVTPGMQDFFDNSEYWKSISFWDDVLYEAVNASLDKTIEETLGGREPGSLFATQYSQFLYWKAKVDERCTGDTVVLPCSKNGTRRDQTDCILADLGCGFDCIDEVFRSNNYFDKQDQRASNP